jgi:hypothetical protein
VLLVYLSCHGLMDARRRLYFAARDTIKNRLASSGVEASWVLDQLEDCRARRQVVILDCCFSGAFGQRSKGDDDIGLGERLVGDGRGRVVLTASRGSEYSFEGEPLQGEAEARGSVFTSALIEGIRSGRADADGDGRVSVDEAYAYAFERVRAAGAQQTPQRWLYGAEGSILLAHVPALEATSDLPASKGSTTPQPTPVPSPEPVPGPPGEPPRVGPGRRPRRRTLVLALVGALVLAGGAIGGVLALRGGGSGAGDASTTDGIHVGADPRSGTITATGPWRLVVDDETSAGGGNDNGCIVTVTPPGQAPIRSDSLYGPATKVQIHQSGTFGFKRSSSRCLLTYLPGAGDTTLPATWQYGHGDTDAFQSPGSVAVTVIDANGGGQCELDLWGAQDGILLATKLAREHQTVALDSGGPAVVYLAGLDCTVTVRSVS